MLYVSVSSGNRDLLYKVIHIILVLIWLTITKVFKLIISVQKLNSHSIYQTIQKVKAN